MDETASSSFFGANREQGRRKEVFMTQIQAGGCRSSSGAPLAC